MDYKIQKLPLGDFPPQLLEIPQPPKELYLQGSFPKDELFLCVVGSRRYSQYGKEICQKIISGLAGYKITIVSGLALGIDAIAHQAALDAGLKTIAVPGSGLDPNILYPKTNKYLAKQILENGGALLSEFKPDFQATPWSFPQRNRIMTRLSSAVLIIGAEEKSGTLITARMAVDYNKNVFVIPGSIFSQNSKGTNRLIKQGATPITSSEELLEELGLKEESFGDTSLPSSEKEYLDCSEKEKEILELLIEPTPRDELIEKLNLPISEINSLLSILEIKGLIKESFGEVHRA